MPGRARIGDLLIEGGVISRAQLDEALQVQVVQGGRIGTNLVDCFALDLDGVSRALGQQHQLPAALERHFGPGRHRCQERVSAELAARWRAVPVGPWEGGSKIILVAVMDPLPREGIEELEEALGGRILAAVAAELRILYQLERAYGLMRPNRYRRIRGAAPPGDDAPIHRPPPPPPERRRYVTTLAEAAPESAAVLGRIATDRRAVARFVGEGQPPEAGGSLRHTVGAIRRATGRNAIGDLAVALLRDGCDGVFSAAMILVIRHRVALGWKGFFERAPGAAVESVAVPLSHPSAIAQAFTSRAAYLGAPLADSRIEERLWHLLGIEPPAAMAVLPVTMFAEVSCLLYGHSAAAIPAAAASGLAELAAAMGTAFERLVRAAQR